jgi:hypothetical protein
MKDFFRSASQMSRERRGLIQSLPASESARKLICAFRVFGNFFSRKTFKIRPAMGENSDFNCGTASKVLVTASSDSAWSNWSPTASQIFSKIPYSCLHARQFLIGALPAVLSRYRILSSSHLKKWFRRASAIFSGPVGQDSKPLPVIGKLS